MPVLVATAAVVACSVYDSSLIDNVGSGGGGTSGAGVAGSGGSGNRGGVGGTAGVAGFGAGGTLAGSAGSAGVAGSSGSSAGSAGDSGGAGVSGAGSSGTSGSGTSGAGTGASAGVSGGGSSGVAGTAGSAGGAGGSAGKAGSGGAGTSGTGGSSGGSGTLVSIDDFEDMTPQIGLPGGGYWYVIDDKTPDAGTPLLTFATLSPARGSSMVGLHFTAVGNAKFGAGAGADFVAVATGAAKKPIDASMYSAVTFYAKIVSGTRANVRFNLVDGGSDMAGALCTGTSVNQCNDHPGMPFTFTTSWVQYHADFASLMTQGFGYPGTVRALMANKVYGLNFTYGYPPAVNVDVWLDDISFIVK